MTIDPILVVSAFTTVLSGIGSGTVHLTDMVPERFVKPIMGWSAFFAFGNSTFLTVLYGAKVAGTVTIGAPP